MTLDHDLITTARDKLAELRVDELARANILPPPGQFMPVVLYPMITRYGLADTDQLLARDTLPPGIPFTAYVHVPFCAFSCRYCHWVKSVNPKHSQVEEYIDLVIEEMRLAARRLGMDRVPISTSIFGGGTPTFLSAAQLERLLTGLMTHFDYSNCRQFSFEAEPTSILGPEGEAKLRVLRDFGVHRVSLGVQSFRDDILERMGRHHSGGQAQEAIAQLRKAGFESVSIDLIYGYPGQQPADWLETMNTAIAAGVDAWQVYRLRILQFGDRQGAIINDYEARASQFPKDDEIRLMKMVAKLSSEQAGYGEHFTRIFARSAKHITHFMWDYCCNLAHVIGVGPSAWSNYNRTLTVNVGDDFARYGELIRAGKLPADRGLYRDDETELRRSLITPLKNRATYKRLFTKRTGRDLNEHFGPELERLKSFDLITENDEKVWLTPRGRFFADETVTQLSQRKYLPFPEVAHDLMPD